VHQFFFAVRFEFTCRGFYLPAGVLGYRCRFPPRRQIAGGRLGRHTGAPSACYSSIVDDGLLQMTLDHHGECHAGL